MVKEYLATKSYDDLKIIEKEEKEEKEKKVENIIEPTDSEKLEMIELLRNGKSIAEVKKECKRGTLSFKTSQIRAVVGEWKEALAEKKPKDKKEEIKVK
jgi:hypothetical protein